MVGCQCLKLIIIGLSGKLSSKLHVYLGKLSQRERGLTIIARPARTHHIVPAVLAPARSWVHMVQCQFFQTHFLNVEGRKTGREGGGREAKVRADIKAEEREKSKEAI